MTTINNQNENTLTNEGIFDGNEFVFTQIKNPDGTKSFVGGGFKVKSLFLQDNIPVMATLNDSEQTGGNVSSPFENLAVPAGLFYINQKVPKNEKPLGTDHKMLSDDIMDKLFGLVEIDKKRKRKTRKHIDNFVKKKTRKQLQH
jgi:hypothetical protein